jgi:hypothetical protein
MVNPILVRFTDWYAVKVYLLDVSSTGLALLRVAESQLAVLGQSGLTAQEILYSPAEAAKRAAELYEKASKRPLPFDVLPVPLTISGPAHKGLLDCGQNGKICRGYLVGRLQDNFYSFVPEECVEIDAIPFPEKRCLDMARLRTGQDDVIMLRGNVTVNAEGMLTGRLIATIQASAGVLSTILSIRTAGVITLGTVSLAANEPVPAYARIRIRGARVLNAPRVLDQLETLAAAHGDKLDLGILGRLLSMLGTLSLAEFLLPTESDTLRDAVEVGIGNLGLGGAPLQQVAVPATSPAAPTPAAPPALAASSAPAPQPTVAPAAPQPAPVAPQQPQEEPQHRDRVDRQKAVQEFLKLLREQLGGEDEE